MKNNLGNLSENTAELSKKPKSLHAMLRNYYNMLEDGASEFIGVKTGFNRMDRITLGLDGLIVLGGIAGQGKTSLALQIAFNVCSCNIPTIFYSLAMPHRAILTKILSRLAKVNYNKILLNGRDRLGEQQKMAFDKANEQLKAVAEKFYVKTGEQGGGEIGLTDIEDDINTVKEKHGVDRVFVTIDPLDSLEVGSCKSYIDKNEKLTNGLKVIIMRTGSTILSVSNFSKIDFKTGNIIENINRSGPIISLADVVMFLEDSKGNEGEMDKIISSSFLDGREVNLVDLIIVKNRYNSPGKIRLQFNGRFSEFTEHPEQAL